MAYFFHTTRTAQKTNKLSGRKSKVITYASLYLFKIRAVGQKKNGSKVTSVNSAAITEISLPGREIPLIPENCKILNFRYHKM
jgi:hypothetical protein